MMPLRVRGGVAMEPRLPCPKCAGIRFRAYYHGRKRGWFGFVLCTDDAPEGEHLCLTCDTCDYQFGIPCADKESGLRAITP